MQFLLKNYIRVHDWIHPRVLSRLGCYVFDGRHPKEYLGNRYKFFRDNVSKDDIVIDIACGTGFILDSIAQKIKYGFGIDFSESQIALARKFNGWSNIGFEIENIFDFDYSGYNYDVVIMSHILEHIKDAVWFLRKIDANKLLICVPSTENWYTQLKWFLGLNMMTDAGHYREYNLYNLKLQVEEAGYIVDYVGFNEDGDIVCRAFKNEKKSCPCPTTC